MLVPGRISKENWKYLTHASSILHYSLRRISKENWKITTTHGWRKFFWRVESQRRIESYPSGGGWVWRLSRRRISKENWKFNYLKASLRVFLHCRISKENWKAPWRRPGNHDDWEVESQRRIESFILYFGMQGQCTRRISKENWKSPWQPAPE